MKYKIGDKVRVKGELCQCKQYYMDDSFIADVVTEDMKYLCGKVVTISDYTGILGRKYEVVEDEHGRMWTDEMFEDEVVK
jgi:hypothetical protein